MNFFKLLSLLVLGSMVASKLATFADLDTYITETFELNPERELEETDITYLYQVYTTIFQKEKSIFGFNFFNENIKQIIKHNQENHSWKMGVNKFVDMSIQDFRYINLMHAPQNCSATVGNYLFKNADIPKKVDWREKGAVSPVKNQGHCGSCWTFSTTGTLESHWKIQKGYILDLSKQQLVDCAGDFDNHGCSGGLPSHAFEYIKQVKGIEGEKTYSYTAADGQCKFNKKNVIAYVSGGAVNITSGNENHLDEAIATVGPVAITFQVVEDFRFYKSGVYTSKNCKNGPMDVNHAVVAVGYGVENQVPYYIVKNSWGTQWGDEGFFKIKRGVNMCGVAVCNSYPAIEPLRTETTEI